MQLLLIKVHTVNTSVEYWEGLVKSREQKGMEKTWRKRERNRIKS